MTIEEILDKLCTYPGDAGIYCGKKYTVKALKQDLEQMAGEITLACASAYSRGYEHAKFGAGEGDEDHD